MSLLPKGAVVSGQNDPGLHAVYRPLKRIPVASGDVLHGLKASADEYHGFGEAYFSCVLEKAVKGWKQHTQMTLNLIVIKGEVRFWVYNEANGVCDVFQMTPDRVDNYGRLTVPPGLWVAFGGVASGENMLLNVASMEHDPAEANTVPLDTFAWSWN